MAFSKTTWASLLALPILACLPLACSSSPNESSSGLSDDDAALASIPQQAHKAVCGEGAPGQKRCRARIRTEVDGKTIKPFATPSGLGPADLASAYKLDPSKTSTATVAIVDAFNYPNAESDLATYRSQFGLPPCTKANGCFKVVNQNGATSPLPGNSPANDDWTVEAALDLDMVSAACPTCKIVLVEAQDDQGNGLFVSQNAAAAISGVVAISDSWGGPSDGTDLSLDSQFFTHSNVNIFVATGDNGVNTQPDYPSTSARVIGVGGTSLAKSSNARGWSEGTWSGAGSSCSTLVAKPGFQSVVPSTACTKRAASDVAAVADPNSGLAVFNAGSGGWIVVGGTSAASPFVAGVYARYGITPSNDASFAYAHTGQFFDITTGKNGSCSGALCNAGAGWDGPTGLGTPNGALLGGGGGATDGGTDAAPDTGTDAGNDGGGSTCSHSDCTTGGKLVATCDPCVQKICAADSFCCSTSWDSVCVGEVKSVCGQTCGGTDAGTDAGNDAGGSTCSHSECSTGAKLVKTCDACVTKICNADSFCCNSTWDSICVSEVGSICGQTCN